MGWSSEYWAVLCWVMANRSGMEDLWLGLLCTNPVTQFQLRVYLFVCLMANLHLLIYWLYVWPIGYISFKEWLMINTKCVMEHRYLLAVFRTSDPSD